MSKNSYIQNVLCSNGHLNKLYNKQEFLGIFIQNLFIKSIFRKQRIQ